MADDVNKQDAVTSTGTNGRYRSRVWTKSQRNPLVPCPNDVHCQNSKCAFTHPYGWRVCSKGLICFDFSCNMIHSRGRLKKCGKGTKCIDANCEDLHPDVYVLPEINRFGKDVKRQKRRLVNRQNTQLPILACAEVFVKRLNAEKVVIVKAETGSGKTTQLPQYCAEEFRGLVVCTQPRVIAAISVAQRVAFEFDGAPVGRNVGYDAGKGRRVEGLRIMIMTDSALIRMAQKDRQLRNVEVLIIDEAHERTLNTDVVVGIAKTVLKQRPDDFKIVVASATMDPKPFLEFLFDNTKPVPLPLIVPGRTYPVTIETRLVGNGMDDAIANLADEVARALKHHRFGHCLVFLQGAREVENTIRKFKKIAHPKWIPLRLYGSLPIKAQNRVLSFDDCNGDLRMVVFCTNVAETSLTIPNVGIVIDTGLAKESRYDADRRMTILDEVYISKSSAAQRRGRAGRTGKGHCIRLYPGDALTRNNIEPEILRSSLDLVMLQVFNLGFNPLEFEFITRPNEDQMLNSLATLTRMGCLTPSLQLTERGRLYNSLPFDPRLSHFVMLMHDVYATGRMAMEIAAILSAPGSIFCFGKMKGPATNDLEVFNSDLLLLHSAYKAWLYAGTIDGNNRCIKCLQQISVEVARMDSGCRDCRIKHAKSNNLNNKNLEDVRATAMLVHKLLNAQGAGSASASSLLSLSIVDMDDAIGVCLAHCFAEQICEFMIPSNPAAGVYIIESGMKGQLSNSSVLRKPNRNSRFLIPMKIKKLPSGVLIVEQAHHIMEECLPHEIAEKVLDSSLDIVECYRSQNLHYRYAAHLRKHFEKKLSEGDQAAAFVVCVYDSPTTTLTVYAPSIQKREICKECQTEVNTLNREDLDCTVVVEHHKIPMKLVVSSGFHIESLDRVEKPCNVNFPNPPVESGDELLALVCRITPCSPSDIKWHKYQPARFKANTNCLMPGFGTIVFFSLEKAKLAESNYISPDGDVASKSQSVDCQPRVIVTSSIGHMDEFLAARNINATDIKALQPQTSKDGQNNFELMTTSFGAKYPTNSARHSIMFQNAEEADKLYNMNGEILNLKVDGVVNVKVERTKGFSIDERLDMIAAQYGVKHRYGKKLEKWQEVVFYDGPPSKCLSAAESLKQMMTPIKYFFGSRDKQIMGRELRSSGKFQQWAKTYSLHIEEMKSKRNIIGIAIHGDGYNQGQFMAQVADYYNTFMTRYHLVGLPQSAYFLFRRMCPGEALLNNLAKAKSSVCEITFQSCLSAIEFVVQPNVARPTDVIKECQAAVNDILSKFQQMPAASKKCVFCHSRPGTPFTICGHPYCKECLEQVIDSHIVSFPNTDGFTQIQLQETLRKLRKGFECCPLCDTKISIKDVKSSISNTSMQNACGIFATLFLKTTDHHLCICPVSSCGQLVEKKQGYASCLACGQEACPLCGVIDDLRHRSLSCAEYRKLVLATFATIDELVDEAKKFAAENWHLDAGSRIGLITSMEVNPGLKNGCMALQRYCTGIKSLGLPTLKGNTIFAWHGTAEAAIPAICSQGFDPTRRRGQAYGPGEYFGIKASISLGYNRGCNRLIVAQLVKCSSLSVHTSFCYVVNNPTDWTYAFNVPVLVVSFGSGVPPPIPWILDVKRPVPTPYFDPGAVASPNEVKISIVDPIVPSSRETSSKPSFRWYWTQRPNDLRPYPDVINDAMEKNYLDRTSSFITEPICAMDSYLIDLIAKTQTNLKTGYVRKIVRMREDNSCETLATTGTRHIKYYWHWEKDDGSLEPYADSVNDLINKNYRGFQLDKCRSVSFDILPTRYSDNAPQTYEIDFLVNIQTNLKTGFVRRIKLKTAKFSSASPSQQSSYSNFQAGTSVKMASPSYKKAAQANLINFSTSNQMNFNTEYMQRIRQDIEKISSASTSQQAAQSNFQAGTSADTLSNNKKASKVFPVHFPPSNQRNFKRKYVQIIDPTVKISSAYPAQQYAQSNLQTVTSTETSLSSNRKAAHFLFPTSNQMNLKTGYMQIIESMQSPAKTSSASPSQQTTQSTFKAGTSANIPSYSSANAATSATTGPGNIQYFWHWAKNDDSLEPYTDSMNDLINKNYRRFQLNECGSASFDTLPITRYKDNAAQAYQIDFSANTQTNLKTGYVRRIERKTAKISSASQSKQSTLSKLQAGPSAETTSYSNANAATSATTGPENIQYFWHWAKDDDSMESYADSMNNLINKNYHLFQLGGSASFDTLPITRYIDNATQAYRIDFLANTQTNLKTGYVRRIERKTAKTNSSSPSQQTVQPNFQLEMSAKRLSTSNANAETPYQWYWTKDDLSLEPYSHSMNYSIEGHYVRCQLGARTTFTTSPITRYNDAVPLQYKIDFNGLTQENLSTGYIRKIERKPKAISLGNNVPKSGTLETGIRSSIRVAPTVPTSPTQPIRVTPTTPVRPAQTIPNITIGRKPKKDCIIL